MSTYFSFTKPVSVFIEVLMNYILFNEKNYISIYYYFAVIYMIQLYIIVIMIPRMKVPKKVN